MRAPGPTAARVRAAPDPLWLQECVVMVSPIQPFRPTATLPLQAPPPEGSAPRGRSFAGTVAPADPRRTSRS